MGTSLYNGDMGFGGRDHPHAYGDKKFVQFVRHIAVGSSPRVWGQVFQMR